MTICWSSGILESEATISCLLLSISFWGILTLLAFLFFFSIKAFLLSILYDVKFEHPVKFYNVNKLIKDLKRVIFQFIIHSLKVSNPQKMNLSEQEQLHFLSRGISFIKNFRDRHLVCCKNQKIWSSEHEALQSRSGVLTFLSLMTMNDLGLPFESIWMSPLRMLAFSKLSSPHWKFRSLLGTVLQRL